MVVSMKEIGMFVVSEADIFEDRNDEEVLDRAKQVVERVVNWWLEKHDEVTDEDVEFFVNVLTTYDWNCERLVRAVYYGCDEYMRLMKLDDVLSVECVADLSNVYRALARKIWQHLFKVYIETA